MTLKSSIYYPKTPIRSRELTGAESSVCFVAFLGILFTRPLWSAYPSWWGAILFWGCALTYNLGVLRAAVGLYFYGMSLASIGSILNGIVTLLNGGRMPVLYAHSPFDQNSVWVLANTSHKLLLLCDRFAGWSLGDMFIACGIMVGLSATLVHRRNVRRLALRRQ